MLCDLKALKLTNKVLESFLWSTTTTLYHVSSSVSAHRRVGLGLPAPIDKQENMCAKLRESAGVAGYESRNLAHVFFLHIGRFKGFNLLR